MTKDKLIKALERLKDESERYSNNNSMNVGYKAAIMDSIDLVKKCSIPHNRQSTFTSTSIKVENMAVDIDQFIKQHALAKPMTYSRKLRQYLADKLNEYIL